MRISYGFVIAAIALTASSQAIFAKPGAAAQENTPAKLPSVSAPVPVTSTSRPLLGAAAAMAAVGYVGEE